MSERIHSLSLERPPVLHDFDYRPRTHISYGAGRLAMLPELVKEYGGTKVLLVTDPGLSHVGHPDRAMRLLRDAGIPVALFDSVAPNPTTTDVDRCVAFAAKSDIDFIVGLGGGSSMDCAKGANFLLTNGGRMIDYRGVGKATKPMLPVIAIPTTAGTGSEAQSFAVIADADSHMKMACGDPKAACRAAILDPELSVTMPRAVAAATGIDAISHAIESFVTKRRNIISRMFSRRAWGLLARSFARIFADPTDLKARGEMLLGANMAGAAIESSMLGAAHALSNPLTAHFDITHGIAVGVMLPHVIRWNGELMEDDYAVLAEDGPTVDGAEHLSGTEELAAQFISLLRVAQLPTSLKELPVHADAIPRMASEAAEQWTGTFNPRPLRVEDFESLYRDAMA